MQNSLGTAIRRDFGGIWTTSTLSIHPTLHTEEGRKTSEVKFNQTALDATSKTLQIASCLQPSTDTINAQIAQMIVTDIDCERLRIPGSDQTGLSKVQATRPRLFRHHRVLMWWSIRSVDQSPKFDMVGRPQELVIAASLKFCHQTRRKGYLILIVLDT